MTAFNDLVDRYIATWNEPDAKRRRRAVTQMWAEDGIHRSRTIEARGHDALVARTDGTFEKWGRTVSSSAASTTPTVTTML